MMSRKEIYAWGSLRLTLAIFAYYILSVFGLPADAESYRETRTGLMWEVIGITFLVQLGLDVVNSAKLRGDTKDEWETVIESKT